MGLVSVERPTVGRKGVIDLTDGGWSPRRKLVTACFVLAVVALIVAGVLRVRTEEAKVTGQVTVTGPASSRVVTITRGTFSLAALSSSLGRRGYTGLVVKELSGGFQLNSPLVVSGGGSLTIKQTALRLASGPGASAGITVGSGTVVITRSTVLSWDAAQGADVDSADGRPGIVAAGGHARLLVDDSVFDYLGSSPTNPGVSWQAGASGSAIHSTFGHNYQGVSLFDCGTVTLNYVTVQNSSSDGVDINLPLGAVSIIHSSATGNTISGLVEDSSAAPVSLTDDVFSGNKANGIQLSGNATVRVTAGEAYDNAEDGLEGLGAKNVSLDAFRAWSNNNGIESNGGTISGKGVLLSGNIHYGALLSTPTSAITLTESRVDHNSASGIWVKSGKLDVTADQFDEDAYGVRVEAGTPTVTITGSTFNKSAKDAIALTGTTGLSITGNTISNSGGAAFSTATAVNIKSIVAANAVLKGQASTRVRGVAG